MAGRGMVLRAAADMQERCSSLAKAAAAARLLDQPPVWEAPRMAQLERQFPARALPAESLSKMAAKHLTACKLLMAAASQPLAAKTFK